MLSRRQRSLLAQLRLGILPLKLETGRFRRLTVEQRVCELCNSNSVEDELHFLFNCSIYEEVQRVLFTQVEYCNVNLRQFSNLDKFKQMMQSSIFPLCKYIDSAWNIRTNYLYN